MKREDSEDNEEEEEDTFISRQWFHEFMENEKKYQDFTISDIHSISLRFIFINRQHEIVQIHHDTLHLADANHISCEELISMIQKHSHEMKKMFVLEDMFKYTISSSSNERANEENQLEEIRGTYLETISLTPCVQIFSDLNEIIFLFKERQPSISMAKTKQHKMMKKKKNATRSTTRKNISFLHK